MIIYMLQTLSILGDEELLSVQANCEFKETETNGYFKCDDWS